MHILLISFSDVSLEALKTKSIKLTFGVGTLIAVPSSFPSKDGITNPIEESLIFCLQNEKIHSTMINTCNEKHLVENILLMEKF